MPADNEKQGQTEVTSSPIQNPWRIFAIEAFLFCLTLLLGIATAFKINEILEIQKFTIPQISFWKFVVYFLLATLLIFLISYFLKFKKGKGVFFKGIFVLATFWGGTLLLSCWMPDLLGLILMIILVSWWLKKPSILNQDLCIILGIAGMGSILGLSLTPQIVVLLLIIFSIYYARARKRILVVYEESTNCYCFLVKKEEIVIVKSISFF